jgi:N6-L-threonylcarbamoyladenine synthase
VGVVDADGRVEVHLVASQASLHARWGGVVPEVASRQHLRALTPLVRDAEASSAGAIDSVAVTTHPGLIGALLVGVRFAAAFSYARGLPLVGIDHLGGHLVSPLLSTDGRPAQSCPEPTLALVASGGHSAWYRMTAAQAERLARTRDDAAGEALDKVARILGLAYPGGAAVDRIAQRGNPQAIQLPRPRTGSADLSFSGLKSAAVRLIRQRNLAVDTEASATDEVCDLLASYQAAVVEQLVAPFAELVEATRPAAVSVSGGVAANSRLRARLAELCAQRGLRLLLPDLTFTADNGAMVAWAGALALASGTRADPLRIDAAGSNRWQPPGMRRLERARVL